MVNTENKYGHIDFPGKDQGEEFQFYFRQHWIRLWWPIRRLIVWTVVIGIGAWIDVITFGTDDTILMRHAILIILGLCLLYVHLSFLVSFYKYFLYIIIVTDKKVHRIKKTMLTVDDHQSIDLWTLEDITKNQHGLIQNMLGFGTLVLVMQTQDALRIHFTPFIAQKHEMIMRLREGARLRMAPQQILQPSAPPNQSAEEVDEVKDL